MSQNLRTLILTGKMVQDHEFTYPYYRVQEEGWKVDVVVPENELVYGIIGTKVEPTMKIEDIRVSDFDLLVIPGGAKCMEYLRQKEELLAFIREFHESGKVIASICHAAQMLISSKIVKGKKISGYYSIKDDINNAGAEYVDAAFVNDGKIITSPHYKHMGPWMKEVIRETMNTCNKL